MENHGSGQNSVPAASAELDLLAADRNALAERTRVPWWYDPALGLLVFQLMASFSTHRLEWIGSAAVIFLVGLAALVLAYQRVTGVWINGLRPGRTRRAIDAWFLVYVIVLSVSVGLEYGLHLRGAMVAGGAVLGVSIFVISRWWMRIYVAELRQLP